MWFTFHSHYSLHGLHDWDETHLKVSFTNMEEPHSSSGGIPNSSSVHADVSGHGKWPCREKLKFNIQPHIICYQVTELNLVLQLMTDEQSTEESKNSSIVKATKVYI